MENGEYAELQIQLNEDCKFSYARLGTNKSVCKNRSRCIFTNFACNKTIPFNAKMSKLRILIDQNIPFIQGLLDATADVIYFPGNKISSEEVKNADGLVIRTRTKCNADLLKDSNIKFIASATIGFDHIDTEFCKENNISWANAPGCNASSVEQYVVSTLLSLAKKYNFELKNKTIGIVGVGNVGNRVKNAAFALGMNVILNDPPRQRSETLPNFVDLDFIQKNADIISFHVPLIKRGIDKTLDLVNSLFFENVKKGIILLNTSRGEIIDEAALEQAIDNGIIQAAVLDVWRNEPNINQRLLNKITFATPHIAGYSADGKAKGTEMSIISVCNAFQIQISDWTALEIPKPKNAFIQIDCKSKNNQEIIFEVYKQCYSILEDDSLLRKSPADFEKFRENYPLRRESKAYRVELKQCKNEELVNTLLNLGFQSIELKNSAKKDLNNPLG
jgi:erythronate-4-phosphate dehydrogenase